MNFKTAIETTQNETHRKKKNSKKQNQKPISELQESFMCVLMYIKLDSLKEKRKEKKHQKTKRGRGEIICLKKYKKFKCDENYKSIDSRNSMISKHRKHKESYARTQSSQIAQNQ